MWLLYWVWVAQLYADLQEQTSGKMKTVRQDEMIETLVVP